MSFPYNYNNSNNSSANNLPQTRTGSDQALQELLKLQQRQIQGSNNPTRPSSTSFNAVPPSNPPGYNDANTIEFLQQAQRLLNQIPPGSQPNTANSNPLSSGGTDNYRFYQRDQSSSQNQPSSSSQSYNNPSQPPRGNYGMSYDPANSTVQRFNPGGQHSSQGLPPQYSNQPYPSGFNSGIPNSNFPSHSSGTNYMNGPQGNMRNNPYNQNSYNGSMQNRNSQKNRNNSNKSQGGNRNKQDSRNRRDNNNRRDDKNRGRQNDYNRRDNDSRNINRDKSPRNSRKRRLSPAEPVRSSHTSRTSRSKPYRYTLLSPKLDYLQLFQRYKKMKIPKDFTHVDCKFTQDDNVKSLASLNFSVYFNCDTIIDTSSTIPDKVDTKHDSEANTSDKVFYSGRILLYSGKRDPKNSGPACSAYRFIVGRKGRSELFCIGGPWSKTIDGGDPATDRNVLIKTATRNCKEFCGLDLSSCTWLSFIEIHYNRTFGKEICVIFIPCIWNLSFEKLLSLSYSENRDKNDDSTMEDVPSPYSDDDTNKSQEDEDLPKNESETESEESLKDTKTNKEDTENENEDTMDESNDKQLQDTNKDDNESIEEETKEDNKDSANKEETKEDNEDSSKEESNNEDSNNEDSNNEDSSNEDNKDKSKEQEENSKVDEDMKEDKVKKEQIPNDSIIKSKKKRLAPSKEPKIPLITALPEDMRLKTLDLSLNGLLEYDDTDIEERTFEVSLCGELFDDMLKYHFGQIIKTALLDYNKKRRSQSEEPPKKKQKLDPNVEKEPSNINTEELRDAFEYFDKKFSGYFYPEDVEEILYILGDDVCAREIEELVDSLIDASSGKVLYKKLISDGVIG